MMSGNNAIFFYSLWQHLWGWLGGASIVLLLLSSIIVVKYYWRFTTIHIPRSIAWVGVRDDEIFSRVRAWIRELTAGLSTVHEGYAKHNQNGKPFVVLDTAGRPNIMVPKELTRWLVSQPDDVLNSRKLIDTKFAVDYLIPHIPHALHMGIILAIRRDLTRNLGRTQKASFNAIRARADELLLPLQGTGIDTDAQQQQQQQSGWHEVNLAAAIGGVISAVSNRTLVGDKLFNNKAFMRSLDSFGNMLGMASLLIGQYAPFFIRRFVGYLASVVVRLYRRRALKYLVPAARERIDDIIRQKAQKAQNKNDLPESDSADYEEAPQLDIMQWIIETCPDASAEEIAALILSLALGATHTSVSISIGVFLDLLSSPPELGYYESIHEEAAAVFRTEEDFGNLASLHKLSRTDSAIKESMRLNPLSARGVMHEVVDPNGVTLPDGQKIPHGAWLGVLLTGVGHDKRYYNDPDTYDPFRFSRARTEIALLPLLEEEDEEEEKKNKKCANSAVSESKNGAVDVDVDNYSTEPAIGNIDNKSSITTTTTTSTTTDHPNNKLNGSWLSTTAEEFGAFGIGRHSCPGRWFASHVMKMTLAYIALNYEIQPVNNGLRRPSNMIIGDVIVPPQDVMIKVRRRRQRGGDAS